MGVFPAASKKHVPVPWAKLMTDPVCITITEIVKNDIRLVLRINMAWQTIILLLIIYLKTIFIFLPFNIFYSQMMGKGRKI